MSAIVGKNPRLSAFDAWAILTGKVSDGFPDGELPDYMQNGLDFERPILLRYAREFKAADMVVMGDVLRMHPNIPFIGGHPDADRPVAGIVPDAKTVLPWHQYQWGPSGSDKVPAHILIQMAIYMAILGRDGAHVPTLIAGHDWRVFEISRNKKLEAALLEHAYRFWHDHVLADIPPPIKPTETAHRFLKENFPKSNNPPREAKSDEVLMAEELAGVNAKIKKLKSRKDQIETVLKLTIGNAEGIEAPHFRISFKGGDDATKVDWESVSRALAATPDLVIRYTKTDAKARRFMPSGKLFREGDE